MSRSRADLLLVARGLFDRRARARAAIEAGLVSADGVVVTKPAELIDEMAEVIATAPHPWVGRGALKLVHALELWPLDLAGRIVLDVGASTGGFTEVCLARGAGRVFAVDVGRDQLHSSLRSEPRVVCLEGTDARKLTTDQITTPPDLVVCDASFIGLAKVLPVPLALARLGADLIALVKPQFEVGPDRVGKGGLVKDEAARAEALSDVVAFIQDSGWDVLATADSPIVGGDGNHEFLVHARKSRPA